MPQYSGGRTTNDNILASVITNWLQLGSKSYSEVSTSMMNEVATLKVVTLPGDTTSLVASIVAIVKFIDQDNVYTKADLISALIV